MGAPELPDDGPIRMGGWLGFAIGLMLVVSFALVGWWSPVAGLVILTLAVLGPPALLLSRRGALVAIGMAFGMLTGGALVVGLVAVAAS